MPIFEYQCDDCGTRFEKLLRRAGETAGIACPSCGEAHLSECLSTFAAHANSSRSPGACSADAMPSCGSGMCGSPGFCSRN